MHENIAQKMGKRRNFIYHFSELDIAVPLSYGGIAGMPRNFLLWEKNQLAEYDKTEL
jgi:hypothetical protein